MWPIILKAAAESGSMFVSLSGGGTVMYAVRYAIVDGAMEEDLLEFLEK